MTIKFNDAFRNLLADAAGTVLGGGTLSVYTGTQPATPATAASGTKLVDITIYSMSAASAGVAALDMGSPSNGVAVATGTAGYARLTVSGYVIDGTVGTSGTDFTINTASITSGATVTLTAMNITQPAS